MLEARKGLLDLISSGIWKLALQEDASAFEWEKIYTQAKMQAVVPLALIAAADQKNNMPAELYERWRREMIGLSLHSERLMQAQDRILGAMEEKQIACAILKGSSTAMYYPDVHMRALGDIDLLVWPRDMADACAVLEALGFQLHRERHPFHAGFYGNGMLVELHHAVSDFPENPGGLQAQRIMADCLRDVQWRQWNGHRFPVLANLHQALSLLLHMQRHMLEGGMGLRQLCDWALFVAGVPGQAFEGEILPMLEKCGLKRFACALTRACIEFLRMDAGCAEWAWQADAECAAALMEEFFRTGNFGRADPGDMSDFMVESRGNRNVCLALFANLNQRARRHFPITEKIPALMPVFWGYLPARYIFRILTGRRNKKDVAKSISVARNRNQLYSQLALFEAETGPEE